MALISRPAKIVSFKHNLMVFSFAGICRPEKGADCRKWTEIYDHGTPIVEISAADLLYKTVGNNT